MGLFESQRSGTVFVSYQHGGRSVGPAQRLASQLTERFGRRALVPTSSRATRRALDTCDVAVVVIGAGWTPGDRQVYREVSSALSRRIPVIPVLVDGASLPRSAELPGGIRNLVNRRHHDLTDYGWQSDVAQLVRAIEALGVRRASGPLAGPAWPSRTMAAVAAGLLAGLLLGQAPATPDGNPSGLGAALESAWELVTPTAHARAPRGG